MNSLRQRSTDEIEQHQSQQGQLFPDDAGQINPGDRVVLIVENDANFARFLFDMAHEHGFKANRAHARKSRKRTGSYVSWPHWWPFVAGSRSYRSRLIDEG